MYQITNLWRHYLLFTHSLQNIKRAIFSFLFCLPTSLLALLLILLLAYNGFSVFSIYLPFPAKFQPEPANFSPEKSSGQMVTKWSYSSTRTRVSSSVMYAVKEKQPVILKAHLPLLQKSTSSLIPINTSLVSKPKRIHKRKSTVKILRLGAESRLFSTRIREFFERSSCKLRFFMTWISSTESFGDRELFVIESLFKSHPNACLVMVSNSLDSDQGSQILRPFLDEGFKVIAIKPDFNYIFKGTYAKLWFNKLRKGNVDPGEVSLGQNLSNLLRLALLYRFGGIYVDTDVILLKSFSKLRNVIGAQTIDVETRNWSRLNNAVLIFDKKHPLLFKFIEEFALTFNGNKWGYNGPYLVSRVVTRVSDRPGFNFSVLPPMAFYPVYWSRIGSLFRGPRNQVHSKWLHTKLDLIRRQSFAVHLWNKQSRKLKVQEGSIIDHIMADCCIFCNSSRSSLQIIE
ncbi:Gly_transf_sug domain-containing protein/Gb3_synth domain-containing protein [Cephalotus follicularis]|uniref:Gly_transf_sug domain-containing protein/Gb3_synth domain-containing protein n=1 Tax=Cephalotus follicularis TaxID=3775 RepID=A0A1Q3D255_CEPFO|nr:Gly_transf_sug domain-containing protein/Gb3_synth domain-containing protein [Cephalotus follicularis]